MNIHNNKNCHENHVTIEDTVTIDDVAALAFKIGVDIWGEKLFMKMINSVQESDNTINLLSSACSTSFVKTFKRGTKTESA